MTAERPFLPLLDEMIWKVPCSLLLTNLLEDRAAPPVPAARGGCSPGAFPFLQKGEGSSFGRTLLIPDTPRSQVGGCHVLLGELLLETSGVAGTE